MLFPRAPGANAAFQGTEFRFPHRESSEVVWAGAGGGGAIEHSNEEINRLVSEFERSCSARKMPFRFLES